MTKLEYMNEINELSSSLVWDAMEENDNDIEAAEQDIFDYMLHETIDGHQWIIYYGYSAEVLQHSYNCDAWEDVYTAEDVGNLIKDHGVDRFDAVRAFYAMYQDVLEHVTNNVIEQYEEQSL